MLLEELNEREQRLVQSPVNHFLLLWSMLLVLYLKIRSIFSYVSSQKSSAFTFFLHVFHLGSGSILVYCCIWCEVRV